MGRIYEENGTYYVNVRGQVEEVDILIEGLKLDLKTLQHDLDKLKSGKWLSYIEKIEAMTLSPFEYQVLFNVYHEGFDEYTISQTMTNTREFKALEKIRASNILPGVILNKEFYSKNQDEYSNDYGTITESGFIYKFTRKPGY